MDEKAADRALFSELIRFASSSLVCAALDVLLFWSVLEALTAGAGDGGRPAPTDDTAVAGGPVAAAGDDDDEIVPLVKAGKITSREHRYHGLEHAGHALADVHTGANTGKAVIVVADE